MPKSKHWNPDWHQESVIVDGTPTPEDFERWKSNPPPDLGLSYHQCPFSGLHLATTVGPDWIVQVRAHRRNEAAWMQETIGRFTWYFICDRPRIRAVADKTTLVDGRYTVTFEVTYDDDTTATVDHEAEGNDLARVEVIDAGESVVLHGLDGGQVTLDAGLYAQRLWSSRPATEWNPSIFDLRVRYVGQAQGRTEETCALDRLESHSTYQKLLEQASRVTQTRDIWLVLASGTNMDIQGAAAADADPASIPTPEPIVAEARKTMSIRRRIDLVEALLINYFKPDLNTHFVDKLNPQATVFSTVRKARINEVALFLSTEDIGVPLVTPHVPLRPIHGATLCMDATPFTLRQM